MVDTRAAPMPATDPSASDTDGATVRWSTTMSQPGIWGMYVRPAFSIVLTEPPPPMPSTRRTWGSRSSSASPSAASRLAEIDASAEPPRTVKSSPDTTDGPAVDLGQPEHEVRRRELDQLAVLVVAADAGGRADLLERARRRRSARSARAP